jgi:predicted nucleotidyltransferase
MELLPRAVEALVRLGARKVVLFGSAATAPATARDIDLAVEGIPPERILDADVAVMDILQQPFDLVSKELNPQFFAIVSRYGKVLYG